MISKRSSQGRRLEAVSEWDSIRREGKAPGAYIVLEKRTGLDEARRGMLEGKCNKKDGLTP